MATRKQKAKVGLFLVACTLLITGGVVMITGFKYEPRVKYFIEFDESVLGLSTGGLVEYMGVPVGNVADIVVRQAKSTGAPVAYVTIEVIRNKVALYRGVTAQLVLYSIATGTMAVSLAGGDPSQGALPPESLIPSKRSLVRTVSSRIESVLDDISDISQMVKRGLEGMQEGDLNALVKRTDSVLENAEEVLQHTNQLIADVGNEAKTGIENFNKVAKDFRALVEDTRKAVIVFREKLEQLNIEQTAENVNKVLNSINELVERLQQTARAIDNLAKSAQYTGGNVEYNLRETLRTLNESLNSVRDLVQYLQRDPSALIRGKGRPAGEQ